MYTKVSTSLFFMFSVVFFNFCHGQDNKKPELNIVVPPFTVDSLGACQGADFSKGMLYLYGDRESGIIREYSVSGSTLRFTGVEMKLSVDGKDVINHPTGLCTDPTTGTFLGNTTVLDKSKNIWKAQIFYIQWDSLYKYRSLDKAIINIIEDDACIQGSRPEYVSYEGEKYIATADYGNKNNEVRLYNPERLKSAHKTSEEGLLAYKFSCSPWVQNLHWIPEKNILVLIQNQIEGRKWRFTFLDMEKSVQSGKEYVIRQVDFDYPDELEGFTLLGNIGSGLALTSSSRNNAALIKFVW